MALPLWGLGLLSPSLGSSEALAPAETTEVVYNGMGMVYSSQTTMVLPAP